MRKIYIFLVFLVLVSTASAQSFTGIVSITDANGNPILSPSRGETIYLKVEDHDRNTQADEKNSLLAEIYSSTEETGETVTFLETDVDTGIFTATIEVDEVNDKTIDNTLQITKGDRIWLVYNDPSDDWGNSKEIECEAWYACTLVSGIITDATWTKSENPYIVTGDVTVDNNQTLNIEPGVVVRFSANSDDQNSGKDNARSEIILLNSASLNAIGSENDSIYFVSNSNDPMNGDWRGLTNGSGYASGANLNLDYCNISYFEQCFFYLANTIEIKNSTISGGNNFYVDIINEITITESDIFCSISLGRVRQKSVLTNSNLYGNVGYYAQFSPTFLIDQCNFINSNRIYIAEFVDPLVSNCNFSSNQEMQYYQDGVIEFIRCSNFIFKENEINNPNNLPLLNFIYVEGSSGEITDTILNGGNVGLYIDGNSPCDVDVLRNNFTNFTEYGIHIGENSTYNIIANYNEFENNEYNVYCTNQNQDEFDFRYNYWGVSTTAEMEAGGNPKNISTIYDEMDNNQYAFINYSQWLDNTPTAIENNSIQFNIYPNPVNNTIYINSSDKIKRITILNQNGALIKMICKNVDQANVSELVPGLYFMNVETNTGKYVHKFLKK